MEIDLRYMERALQLARLGREGAHPNPMVGCVIVDPSGRIVGEGYHQKCGEGHAEVNAIADADRRGADLTDVTMYVTLEPCAHWGKTPPCAQLILDRKIPRVVVGCTDSFDRVDGKGIKMLREGGVELNILELPACRALNKRFFEAHLRRRPWVALKWAQTADGFVDRIRESASEAPLKISTPATQVAVHAYRAGFDAIAVGSRTAALDNPRLDTRLWPGSHAPRRVEFHRGDLRPQLEALYAEGITSLLVEGGPTLQRAFIAAGPVDELRVETSPALLSAPGVRIPR